MTPLTSTALQLKFVFMTSFLLLGQLVTYLTKKLLLYSLMELFEHLQVREQ